VWLNGPSIAGSRIVWCCKTISQNALFDGYTLGIPIEGFKLYTTQSLLFLLLRRQLKQASSAVGEPELSPTPPDSDTL
jgi:hypothetical protein